MDNLRISNRAASYAENEITRFDFIRTQDGEKALLEAIGESIVNHLFVFGRAEENLQEFARATLDAIATFVYQEFSAGTMTDVAILGMIKELANRRIVSITLEDITELKSKRRIL